MEAVEKPIQFAVPFLAKTDLDDQQKLQVALCRRQCWIRAAQLSVLGCVSSYAAVVLSEAVRGRSFQRGTRTAVPLGVTIFFGYLGSYLGGREGAATMGRILAVHNETLRSRPKQPRRQTLDSELPAESSEKHW